MGAMDPSAAHDDFRKVATGLRWSSTAALVTRVAQFGVGIVAARIIAPDQFGAFAVATTIFGVVLTLSDLGVCQAILREVRRTPQIGPTVMTLNMGATLVLAAAMALFAPQLAGWFGTPSASPAIRVLALTLVAGAVGSVPAMVLARDYRQKERFYSDLLNFLSSSVFLVVFALDGWGVMALAWSRFVGQVVSAIVLNLAARSELYSYGFDRREAGALLRFSVPLATAMAVGVCIQNVDNFAVGRFRGAQELGYYNLAFTMAQWPIGILSQVIVNISTTTFARSQHDPAMLRYHLRSMITALSAVTFPAALLIMALSEPLVVAVYGHRWQPAAAPLLVMGLFTIVRLLQVMLTDLFTAVGQTKVILWIQALWLVVLVPVMLVAVQVAGTVGAALAHVAVGLVIVIPAYLFAVRARLDIGMSWLHWDLLRPLSASVAAGLMAYVVSRAIEAPLTALLAGAFGGGVVYLALVSRWLWRVLVELRSTYGGGNR